MRLRTLVYVLAFSLLCSPAVSSTDSEAEGGENSFDALIRLNVSSAEHFVNASEHDHEHGHGIHVASWEYETVKQPLIITVLALVIALFKIAFHHSGKLAQIVPESCVLILIGILIGLVFKQWHERDVLFLRFDSRNFLLFLLPPIVLESAFSLRDKAFVNNIGTILLYAVVGTILNIVLIGPLLYLMVTLEWFTTRLGLLECLLYASILSAVDPVAVLAIFQELGVNNMLYFMVFGESLLNDAVTIVMYQVFLGFLQTDDIGAKEVLTGVAAFGCVTLGSIVIGTICGFLTAFITKHTIAIRVVEPLIMLFMAYLAFLLAEMVHFSGIISIICCGMVQSQYAAENISAKSFVTVHYVTKVAAGVTESIIFIILGCMLVIIKHDWDPVLAVVSVVVCLFARFVVVYSLTALVNKFEEGIRRISAQEQFIMAYGGLRGAISFSLAFMLSAKVVPANDRLLTSTITVILFTVFALGITIKPLVRVLRIRTQTKDPSIFRALNDATAENIVTAVETIIGHRGVHYWSGLLKYLSQHFLRPVIQTMPHHRGMSIVTAYQQVSMQANFVQCSSGNGGGLRPVDSAFFITQELKQFDKVGVPPSASDAFLDHEDDKFVQNARSARLEARTRARENGRAAKERKLKGNKRKQPPPPLKLDTPSDYLMIVDALKTPLHKTVMYKDFDKTLNRNVSTENFERMTRMMRFKSRSIDVEFEPGGSRPHRRKHSAFQVVPVPVNRLSEEDDMDVELANQRTVHRQQIPLLVVSAPTEVEMKNVEPVGTAGPSKGDDDVERRPLFSVGGDER